MEFIVRCWLEVAFTAVVGGATLAMKLLYNRMKTELEEQKVIKDGLLAILHDRLYQACQYHLQKGIITVGDLDNLKYLYRSYSALGGNDTGTELYNRCLKLPIEQRLERDR